MPNVLWKHIGIAAATLGGLVVSVAILWGLYGSSLARPEQWLPQDTVALISEATSETQALLRQAFPLLSTLPTLDPTATAALVKTPEGRLGWIVFTPRVQVGGNPYEIEAAPDARALIMEREESLEDAPAYRTLVNDRSTLGTWVFLNADERQETPWPWLKLSEPVGLVFTSDEIRMSVVSEGSPLISIFRAQLPSAFASPLFVLSLPEASDMLRVPSAVEGSIISIGKGLATTWIKEVLGTAISPTYDLSPLTRQQILLHLAQDSGGRTLAVLEGSAPRDTVDAFSEKVFASFKASLPLGKRETRTFDDSFTFDLITQDASALIEETKSVNGWSVRSMKHAASQKALLFASDGTEFLLSNDEAALLVRIAQTLPPTPLPDAGGQLLAAGRFNSTQLTTFLGQSLPSFWKTSLSLPNELQGDLVWTVTRERGRVTLQVQRLKIQDTGKIKAQR